MPSASAISKTNGRYQIKHVELSSLRPHPRNYVKHPKDQIKHIAKSIEQHGFYRNIVIADDDVILAGHGVAEAAKTLGINEVPVIRLGVKSDDPRALKVMAADNTLAHLSEVDDRALTEILKELNNVDELFGTGYDENMLANLAMITRPANEIKDFNAAAEWVGMPGYEPKDKRIQLSIICESQKHRNELINKWNLKCESQKEGSAMWVAYWPERKGKDDMKSVRFE